MLIVFVRIYISVKYNLYDADYSRIMLCTFNNIKLNSNNIQFYV